MLQLVSSSKFQVTWQNYFMLRLPFLVNISSDKDLKASLCVLKALIDIILFAESDLAWIDTAEHCLQHKLGPSAVLRREKATYVDYLCCI